MEKQLWSHIHLSWLCTPQILLLCCKIGPGVPNTTLSKQCQRSALKELLNLHSNSTLCCQTSSRIPTVPKSHSTRAETREFWLRMHKVRLFWKHFPAIQNTGNILSVVPLSGVWWAGAPPHPLEPAWGWLYYLNWLINIITHVLTAAIRKKKICFISMFSHQRNKHRGLGFVEGAFKILQHFFHSIIMDFIMPSRYLITTRGGIKSVFDGFISVFIALIYQEGERWWWELGPQWSQPTTLLGQQSQEPSSGLAQGFPSSSICLPGKWNRIMDHIWVTPGFATWEKGPGTVWVALSLSQLGLPLRGCGYPSQTLVFNPVFNCWQPPLARASPLSAAIKWVHFWISEFSTSLAHTGGWPKGRDLWI